MRSGRIAHFYGRCPQVRRTRLLQLTGVDRFADRDADSAPMRKKAYVAKLGAGAANGNGDNRETSFRRHLEGVQKKGLRQFLLQAPPYKLRLRKYALHE